MSVSELNTQIGDRIRQLRLASAKGQTEVAKALSISVAALSKIENGITDLNISRLVQIARYFNVSITNIIVGDETGRSPNIAEQLNLLRAQLSEKDAELSKLRKKVIDLYDKLGL